MQSGPGRALPPSPQPSAPCWVDGSPSTVPGDGSSSSMCRWAWRSLLISLWKVPESRAGRSKPAFRLAGRPFGRCSASAELYLPLIESEAFDERVGAIALWLCCIGNRARPPRWFRSLLPLEEFQRSQPAHFLPLRRLKRRPFLFPDEFDPGARLFANRGRRGSAAFHLADVLAVAVVRRTSRSLRREGAVGARPVDRGRRLRTLCEARHRGPYWTTFFPAVIDAWVRHGYQRGPADHDSDERGGSSLRGSGFRDQQRCFPSGRVAGGRGLRSPAGRSFPELSGSQHGSTRSAARSEVGNRCRSDLSWLRLKPRTHEGAAQLTRLLSPAIAWSYGCQSGSRWPVPSARSC